jgi:hypothetical protein
MKNCYLFQKFKHKISHVILKIMSNFKNVETFLEFIDYLSLRNKIEAMISKYFQKRNSTYCLIFL